MAFFDLFPAKHSFKGGQKAWKAGLGFGGTPDTFEQKSLLRPEQEPLLAQAVNAGINPGAGGAFGTSADYYRDLLSNDPETLRQLSAPELRQFNEQIMPGISEQFVGMGSGGLSSSGFQNAATNAGTDLAERLGAIRANLRSQGAAGLTNIGQIGLGQYQENLQRPGTPGLLESFMPILGNVAGAAVGGPAGAAIGGGLGTGGQNWLASSRKGRSSPYGSRAPMPNYQANNFQLPNFNSTYGMR